MFIKPLIIFTFLLSLKIAKVQSDARSKFNAMYCDAVDDDFVEFEKCELKVISRNRRAGIITARLKKHITQCTMHMKIMQKFNSWHPLFDGTIDACEFFRNPKKYPLLNVAFQYGKHVTNAQHKCPYKENEYIRVFMPEPDVSQLNEMLRKLPIDIGQYGVFIEMYNNGQLKATINTTTTYSDYKKS